MGKKKMILGIAGVLVMLIIIFLLQPAPVDPAAFTPPAAPALAGLLAPNNLLQQAELLAWGEVIIEKTIDRLKKAK